jgi:hypothetical protein
MHFMTYGRSTTECPLLEPNRITSMIFEQNLDGILN